MAVDTRAHTKKLPDTGRKHSLAQKAYQIVNTFSGDVGGDAAPPTFVRIRRICRLRRSLIFACKINSLQIRATFG